MWPLNRLQTLGSINWRADTAFIHWTLTGGCSITSSLIFNHLGVVCSKKIHNDFTILAFTSLPTLSACLLKNNKRTKQNIYCHFKMSF